ncbi:hypothetical protein NNC19_08080 [Clostridium sp. SHJSY1]|uniref:CsxC family protein n=1 Tax=Clostridium sp. SHJSY1 TaxID=2942483 RepID=UPI0028743C80|nr:hypothetical protein [Clostridium sp. SHJSY1]MDS0525632.1 hypothetical protein [Clostridium sp. SHJSY1]
MSNEKTTCPETKCHANVLSADTLTGATNYPVCGGDYKIPKVLAEFVIQIDSESVIELNEPAYEIKRIEKQVFLTQCRYIAATDKVFIEGYVRKNIEYATKTCTTCTGIGGDIKDTTVHIPFKAYTKVNFKHQPQIQPNLPPMVARYFDEKRMGKNIREADRSDVEIFNEPVYCELEWSAVFDADIDHPGCPIKGFPNEEEFHEFTDKAVVYLCIKLLQKQQVIMPEVKEVPKKAPASIESDWNFLISELTKRH